MKTSTNYLPISRSGGERVLRTQVQSTCPSLEVEEKECKKKQVPSTCPSLEEDEKECSEHKHQVLAH